MNVIRINVTLCSIVLAVISIAVDAGPASGQTSILAPSVKESGRQADVRVLPRRAGTKGSRVAFSSKSTLNVDQVAKALFNAETAPCLQGDVVVVQGAQDQFQVYATSGAGFPTDGDTYLVISSGDATLSVPSTAATFSSVSQGSAEGVLPALQGGSPSGHPTFDRAALSVTICVPNDATCLSFDWKFASEEPPSFLGTRYQDYFRSVLEGNTIVTTVDDNIAAGANLPGGSSASPTPPLPAPNNTVYNSTTPGVQTALFDVTPFQGSTVTLVFHVADASDSVLDSAVFLDNVRFDTACEDYEYAAKVVCGMQKDPQDERLARGFYATAVNIHNPNDFDVTFFKKLALTYPPGGQKPGQIHPIATDVLKPDQALQVDCLDLKDRLFPGGLPAPYIKGFLVIQSPVSLDVTAVYTAAALDEQGRATAHSSIDVEQIRGRKIPEQCRQMELDHFKVYQVERINLEEVIDDLDVMLKGQFDDESKPNRVRTLTHFSTPVRKNGERLVDPNAHFTWYRLQDSDFEFLPTIEVENQFGKEQIFKLGRAVLLLTPAQKIEPSSSFPGGLDHYKCYTVEEFEPPINTTVSLEDQFGGPENVKVIRPRFFCVPVQKTRGEQITEIHNQRDHLTVYEITPQANVQSPRVTDQFFRDSITLGTIRSVYLCVPSTKRTLD